MENICNIFAFPHVAAMPIDPCKVVMSHVYLFAEQRFLPLYPTDAKSSWLNHFIEFKVPLNVERGLWKFKMAYGKLVLIK